MIFLFSSHRYFMIFYNKNFCYNCNLIKLYLNNINLQLYKYWAVDIINKIIQFDNKWYSNETCNKEISHATENVLNILYKYNFNALIL